jgi:hypothetical protein
MSIQRFCKNLKSITAPLRKIKKDHRETIPMPDFVEAFLFSLANPSSANSSGFSLAGLFRDIASLMRLPIPRSTGWEKIASNRFVNALKAVLSGLAKNFNFAENFKPLFKLCNVDDILIIDSTHLALSESLKDLYPSSIGAGLKLHTVFSILRGNILNVLFSKGCQHDALSFPYELGSDLKNKLVIADLGYFSLKILNFLAESGAKYLLRLKSNASVRIIEGLYGLSKRNNGRFIGDLSRCRGKLLIIRGAMEGLHQPAIMIGYWSQEDRQYHWYITNLEQIQKVAYEVYCLRWQIEIFFKGMKSLTLLDHIPTQNENILQSLVIGRLIYTMMSLDFSQNVLKYYYPDAAKKSESILRKLAFFKQIGRDLYYYISLKFTANWAWAYQNFRAG